MRKKITFTASPPVMKAAYQCARVEGYRGAGGLARRELVKYLLSQGLITVEDAVMGGDSEE